MTEALGRQPEVAVLSDAMTRVVQSLRRIMKSIYFVDPAHSDTALAEAAETLAASIESAGTMKLRQTQTERHTRNPLSGSLNPMAPPVSFEYHADKVVSHVNFHEGYQGPPSCVHGGYVAALLDEVLGRTRHLTARNCVTGLLAVTYRKPTPLNTDLVVEARIVELFDRKMRVTGEITHDGVVTASAEAIFVFLDVEKFNALVSKARDASR